MGLISPASPPQLFRDIDFRDKTMLEIGCGKGMLCLWAALHGARDVVGLEPLAEGCYDSSECHKAFRSMAEQLDLPQARILPVTVQGFDSPKNYFDVVLSVASINHLDEKSCIALGESAAAVTRISKHLPQYCRHDEAGRQADHHRTRRGTTFLATSACAIPCLPILSGSNTSSRISGPGCSRDCGFGHPDIRWTSGKLLRYARVNSLPKALSYFGQSIFRLEMTRI